MFRLYALGFRGLGSSAGVSVNWTCSLVLRLAA